MSMGQNDINIFFLKHHNVATLGSSLFRSAKLSNFISPTSITSLYFIFAISIACGNSGGQLG